jgi:hypothetical protein
MTEIVLIDYKEYPIDEWTKALCTILVDSKHMITYGKKCTKDGKQFWAPAIHSVKSGTTKVFVEGYLPDSGSMKKQIISFIEKIENDHHSKPTSMSEVAQDDGLPF